MDNKTLMSIAAELVERAEDQVVVRGSIWFGGLEWPTFRRKSTVTIELYTLCTDGDRQGFYAVHYRQEDGQWAQGREPKLILLGNDADQAREALFERWDPLRDSLWGVPLWLTVDQVITCQGTRIDGKELDMRRVSPWDFRLMLHYTRLHTYLSVIQQREGDEAWYLKDMLRRFGGFFGEHIARWREFTDS